MPAAVPRRGGHQGSGERGGQRHHRDSTHPQGGWCLGAPSICRARQSRPHRQPWHQPQRTRVLVPPTAPACSPSGKCRGWEPSACAWPARAWPACASPACGCWSRDGRAPTTRAWDQPRHWPRAPRFRWHPTWRGAASTPWCHAWPCPGHQRPPCDRLGGREGRPWLTGCRTHVWPGCGPSGCGRCRGRRGRPSPGAGAQVELGTAQVHGVWGRGPPAEALPPGHLPAVWQGWPHGLCL